MPSPLPAPLGGPPPAEISLPRAPLARVLTQVRFPTILKIEQRESIIPFQELIRERYPLFVQETNEQIRVEIGPAGQTMRPEVTNVWRFLDLKQEWRISLTPDAVALETPRYTSRDDFLLRWLDILAAVARVFEPAPAQRIGMRFIDQVTGEPLERIDTLVRSDAVGMAMPLLRGQVRHTMSEAALGVEEGEMMMRWGILPANATIDPAVLPAIPQTSWILDIDVWSAEPRNFAQDIFGPSFRALAERAYSVFRFMTTESFLRSYGAEL